MTMEIPTMRVDALPSHALSAGRGPARGARTISGARRGTASIEYRALHALVRALAFGGGAVARALPFGGREARRVPLAVESRHVADSVVPFVFQVA